MFAAGFVPGFLALLVGIRVFALLCFVFHLFFCFSIHWNDGCMWSCPLLFFFLDFFFTFSFAYPSSFWKKNEGDVGKGAGLFLPTWMWCLLSEGHKLKMPGSRRTCKLFCGLFCSLYWSVLLLYTNVLGSWFAIFPFFFPFCVDTVIVFSNIVFIYCWGIY